MEKEAEEAGWAAVQRAAAELGPGWQALRPGAGPPWLLLHESRGIAAIGLGPDAGAVAALRRALEGTRFVQEFGGCPPILYRPLPPSGIALSEVVEAAFALEPPPALSPRAGPWAAAAAEALGVTADVARAVTAEAVRDVTAEAAPPPSSPPASWLRRAGVGLLLVGAALVLAAGAWQSAHPEESLPERLAAWLSALAGR